LKPGDALKLQNPADLDSMVNDPARSGTVQIQNEMGRVLLRGNALGGLQLGGSESGTGIRRLAFEVSTAPSITDTGFLDIRGNSDGTGSTLYSVKATSTSSPVGTVTANIRFFDVKHGFLITILIDPESNCDVVIQQQYMSTGSSKVLRKGTSSMFIVYKCSSGNGNCLSPLS
jgi:hypothetical protein